MPSTFIKAAEFCPPSSDGSLLELHSAAFGSARRFRALSRSMCFGRGEGLPGRAWDESKPILLADFNGSDFRRVDAARQAGYRCAIALPYFSEQAIASVLVPPRHLLAAGDRAAGPRLAARRERVSRKPGRGAGAFSAR